METMMKNCLNCNRSENEVPLVTLAYHTDTVYICPQCLPVLIHKPAQLTGKLAGAEGLSPAEHED